MNEDEKIGRFVRMLETEGNNFMQSIAHGIIRQAQQYDFGPEEAALRLPTTKYEATLMVKAGSMWLDQNGEACQDEGCPQFGTKHGHKTA